MLADENLQELSSSDTGDLSGVQAPSDGTYLLITASAPVTEVQPEDDPRTLTLTLIDSSAAPAPVADGPRTLSYGEAADGVIDDERVSQFYAFNGQAGDRVRITMEATAGSDLDCYVELQDENGAVIGANDDIDPGVVRDSRIVANLPADGTYTVIASRYVGPDAPTTSGEYRITLDRVDDSAPLNRITSSTKLIAYGQTEVDEINDDQMLLFYVFDGMASDIVTIEVDHLSGNLDSVLHLYRSEGDGWVEIASNDDSPTGGTYAPLLSNVSLPQTGKYLIALSRYGLASEASYGTFALTLEKAE